MNETPLKVGDLIVVDYDNREFGIVKSTEPQKMSGLYRGLQRVEVSDTTGDMRFYASLESKISPEEAEELIAALQKDVDALQKRITNGKEILAKVQRALNKK